MAARPGVHLHHPGARRARPHPALPHLLRRPIPAQHPRRKTRMAAYRHEPARHRHLRHRLRHGRLHGRILPRRLPCHPKRTNRSGARLRPLAQKHLLAHLLAANAALRLAITWQQLAGTDEKHRAGLHHRSAGHRAHRQRRRAQRTKKDLFAGFWFYGAMAAWFLILTTFSIAILWWLRRRYSAGYQIEGT